MCCGRARASARSYTTASCRTGDATRARGGTPIPIRGRGVPEPTGHGDRGRGRRRRGDDRRPGAETPGCPATAAASSRNGGDVVPTRRSGDPTGTPVAPLNNDRDRGPRLFEPRTRQPCQVSPPLPLDPRGGGRRSTGATRHSCSGEPMPAAHGAGLWDASTGERAGLGHQGARERPSRVDCPWLASEPVGAPPTGAWQLDFRGPAPERETEVGIAPTANVEKDRQPLGNNLAEACRCCNPPSVRFRHQKLSEATEPA